MIPQLSHLNYSWRPFVCLLLLLAVLLLLHFWFERGTRFESLAGLEFIVFTKLALNSQSSVCVCFLWAGTKGLCHHAQLARTDFKASPLPLPLGGGGGEMWGTEAQNPEPVTGQTSAIPLSPASL